MEPQSARDVADRLGETGYLSDESLATVTFLALRMQRPLLLEGEPGTGKTALAEAIAESLELPLVRLQCYEGIDATPGALRLGLPAPDPAPAALEARRRRGRRRGGREEPVRRPLPARASRAGRAAAEPRGAARRRGRPGRRRVRGVPARGAVDVPGDDPRARHRRGPRSRRSSSSPPTGPASCTTRSSGAASTTGSTTRAWSARSRSCAPGRPRCRPSSAARSSRWSSSCATATTCRSRPGVAETLDWARALHHLGSTELDLATASATLGALVKYREDADRVRQALDQMLRT